MTGHSTSGSGAVIGGGAGAGAGAGVAVGCTYSDAACGGSEKSKLASATALDELLTMLALSSLGRVWSLAADVGFPGTPSAARAAAAAELTPVRRLLQLPAAAASQTPLADTLRVRPQPGDALEAYAAPGGSELFTLPSYERLSALSREAVSAALAVDFDLRAFCAGLSSPACLLPCDGQQGHR